MIKKEFINTSKKHISQVLTQTQGLSFNNVKAMLRKGDIRINNKRIKEDILLQGGECITYFTQPFEPEVIYQDENILIIYKPKKIQTTGSNSLTDILQKKYKYCMPCHRLDTNTTGIVVFALNEMAYIQILDAFKKNKVEKKYVAVVCGQPKQHQMLNAFLLKDAQNSKVLISNKKVPNSTAITTEYTLLKSINSNLSLLDVTLHTGKTHQIRAHLAHVGLPVLGDRKYGNSELNKKYKKQTQCLTSYSIKFDFSPSSELYYLSNRTFKVKKDADKLYDGETN